MSNVIVNVVFLWVFHFQVDRDWRPSIKFNDWRWEHFNWRRCFEVCQ